MSGIMNVNDVRLLTSCCHTLCAVPQSALVFLATLFKSYGFHFYIANRVRFAALKQVLHFNEQIQRLKKTAETFDFNGLMAKHFEEENRYLRYKYNFL